MTTSLSTPQTWVLLLLAAVHIACGNNSTADNDEFSLNAPTYSNVSLEMDVSDATPPTKTPPSPSGAQALEADACHPHLFVRSHDVAHVLNVHVELLLSHVKELTANPAGNKLVSKHVWTGGKNGVARRLSVTKSNGTYTFLLEMASIADTNPTYFPVLRGSQTSTATEGDGGVSMAQIVGTMTFDFSALQSMIPANDASGKITVNYDVRQTVSKKLVYQFSQFVPMGGDPHGPRDGSAVYLGKVGIGGSFKYSDTLVLGCPDNPAAAPAELSSISEWFTAKNGSTHGRTDTRGTGGQMGAGNAWHGMTCFQGTLITNAFETYWMMKVENGAGGTVSGSAAQASAIASSSCDAEFINGNATTPLLDANTSDFPFGTYFSSDGSLKDTTPFLFPALQ